MMEKRKLHSDSALEKAEGTRALWQRSMETRLADSPPKKKHMKYSPKEIQKKTSATLNPSSIPHFIVQEVTEVSPIPRESTGTLQPEIPEGHLSPRQTTRWNILTVISKSLSGLRLRQNLVLSERIHPDSQAYASAISRSTLLADKLLAFRTLGPSFSAIKSTLLSSPDIEVDGLFLTRWMIMRLYAFGHPDLIISLGTIKNPEDVLKIREAYKVSTGFGVNSLPVYGNIRFDPRRISGHLGRIFDGASKLFTTITQARKPKDRAISFKEVMHLIDKASIPYYSSGSLLQWLLACDLAELDGIVAPPTARDLATRIECSVKKKKGGSGTWNGLVRGIEKNDWPEVTIDNLTNYLEWIYHSVRESLGVQGILFRERGFWYSDLEHCLCKVSRAEKY